MRLLAALVLLTSCNRTTPVDDRTAGASSPLVTSTAPVHEIAWLRQSKLDLPARATPRATERGFELRADGAAAGFVRHGLHVVAPAFANGTVRLASSVRDDVWLELFADDLAHASRGALEDDALVFRDVQPATDLVWMMGGDRFEELRVIHEPRSRVEGRWHVRLGPGLRELVVVDGQIRAIDARGYAWFQSLPLVAVDAKGTSRNAVASVARSSGGFTLVVGADTSAMTPPIALDPSFTSGGVLKAPVTDHWAGKLATGKVFIGYGVPELYDPATNT
ncbi:MAG: hypothetical protein ACXVEE_39625, partial [Polyangiales bacterium]